MIVAVTGSRHWADEALIGAVLDRYLPSFGGGLLRVGDCPSGADYFARKWRAQSRVGMIRYDADWARHGFAAGPIRNREMLDDGAELLIAFKLGAKSKGTDDCIAAARERAIPVLLIQRDA